MIYVYCIKCSEDLRPLTLDLRPLTSHRRSSRNNVATAGYMVATQRLGKVLLTYMNIYQNCYCSSCHHR
jgi:hypothetical protein